MVSCGDLDESEEYLNPIIFDFLFFAPQSALGAPVGDSFLINCDDFSNVTSRKRGSVIQHEYPIRLSRHDWNDSKQSVFEQHQDVLTS